MDNPINIPQPDAGRKRVVIVGGGFGGLKLARQLPDDLFQVVLLDRNNYHQFQPLLYQVATSGLEPATILFPFRKIFSRRPQFHFRICEVESVVPSENILETSIGAIGYDILVLAFGARTNFFGHERELAGALTLKSVEEAIAMRNHILQSMEEALNTPSDAERTRLMTFVISGGGATGVELAGAISGMKKHAFRKDYPQMDLRQMRIVLVDAGPRMLPAFSEPSSAYTRRYLERAGVEVMTGAAVSSYDGREVVLGNGTVIPTRNLFWVAGIAAPALRGIDPATTGRGGRMATDQYNRIKGYSNIYAIGDAAATISPRYPNGHPQVAPVAVQQAGNLSENLICMATGHPLRPFVYKDKGSLATIGRNGAVAEISGLRLRGFIAWALWLFVHLMSIVGVKNRFVIFIDWMQNYLTYNQSLRLLIRRGK